MVKLIFKHLTTYQLLQSYSADDWVVLFPTPRPEIGSLIFYQIPAFRLAPSGLYYCFAFHKNNWTLHLIIALYLFGIFTFAKSFQPNKRVDHRKVLFHIHDWSIAHLLMLAHVLYEKENLSKWLSGAMSLTCLTLNELILMTIHSEHKIARFRVPHGAISMVISSFCMLHKLKKSFD